MTFEEYNNRLQTLPTALTQRAVEAIITPAVNEVLAELKNRIVRNGQNSNGQEIGKYSQKQAYFTREQFDRRSSFKPKGKANSGNFKNGKARKSMFIPTGYKGLRDIQGKPTDNIKANYTGSTMAAYQLQAKGESIVIGMTDNKSSEIRKGLEKQKKQDIYKPSVVEIENYRANVFTQFKELNLKIITGVSV